MDASLQDGSGEARSGFTYRHLSQMASFSPTTPLRVIAHVDLDAFYAQCEMVRLGVPEDVPLAVRQWQGLIAINYPARKFGITRHLNITEARKLCPNLVAQHVATWREGDDSWSYRPDAPEHIATDKVSLDPYRLESRKILSIIKDTLPPQPLQRVEKASIDEVYMDLSAQVHHILLARFPELASPPPGDDPSYPLPPPPVSALDWKEDHLVPLPEAEESRDPDWDDVILSIAADIVRDVRGAIHEKLRYTCSGGVSHNKFLSKLGSAANKPAQQTVIRHRATDTFLSPMKFTKMRNLGGKLGEQVAAEFSTEEVAQLLAVPLDQMKARLGHETGTWVYNTIRGVDQGEVNPRTSIKSMLSAKSFRPPIHSREQADRWIKIFAADIHARLVEEEVLENRRRPKTVNMHLKHGAQTRSRQGPIPPGRLLDLACLVELGRSLLTQIAAEGEVWPCMHLSLSVSGFEDGVMGNMGIGSFLVKGADAQALRASSGRQQESHQVQHGGAERPERKRRHSGSANIERFFRRPSPATSCRKKSGVLDGANGRSPPAHGAYHGRSDMYVKAAGEENMLAETECPAHVVSRGTTGEGKSAQGGPAEDEGGWGTWRRCPNDFSQTADDRAPPGPSQFAYICERCQAAFDDPDELQSHGDWHMAVDLEEKEKRVEERVRSAFASRGGSAAEERGRWEGGRAEASSSSSSTTEHRSQGRGGRNKLEPGQRRLKFG